MLIENRAAPYTPYLTSLITKGFQRNLIYQSSFTFSYCWNKLYYVVLMNVSNYSFRAEK